MSGRLYVQAYSTHAGLLNGSCDRQQLARAALEPVELQLVYAV